MSYGLYLLFLMGIVLPFQLALVPLYAFMKDTGLLGSYSSMILFYTGLQMPLTIFLYTGFLRALPREYGEAALVDGATQVQSFTARHLPAAAAGHRNGGDPQRGLHLERLRDAAIYLGGTPNRDAASRRLPVRRSVRRPTGATSSPRSIIASLPVLFVFALLQRYVIKGFTSGVKG